MLTNLQETSLSVYRTEVQPKLGEKQAVVLAAFTPRNGMTDAELQEVIGWPINCLTNRRGELVKKNLLREHCRRKQNTSDPAKNARTAICFEKVPQNGQLF